MATAYEPITDELDNSSVEKKLQKEHDKLMKKMNKHFHVVSHFNPRTERLETLKYYSSGEIGSPIKMAVTGSVWNPKFRVGSRAEDLFFKVTVATGETGKDPVNLFYENPEQYENHQGIMLDVGTKEQWQKKYYEAKRLFDI